MNFLFSQIKDVFEQAGVMNFERIPPEIAERKKFADLFRQFNDYLEAAKVQGFTWKKLDYSIVDEGTGEVQEITMALNETTYLILVKRYKELFGPGPGPGGEDVPYDIEGYITTIDTDKIDSDYMNSRFEKYLKFAFFNPFSNSLYTLSSFMKLCISAQTISFSSSDTRPSAIMTLLTM